MIDSYISQQNHQKTAEILAFSGSSSIRIIDFLLLISHKYEQIFPSLDLIAKDAGISKRQVQRILKKLRRLKLLIWQKRHYTSNLYTLNPVFYDYTFRRMVAPLFKVLQVFFLGLLISSPKTQKENVHVLNKEFNINNCTVTVFRNIDSNGASSDFLYETKPTIKPPGISQGENMTIEAISAEVKSVGSLLGLTLAGQVKLMAYPVEAVKSVYNAAKQARLNKIKNPMFWAMGLCKVYCNENGIRPDWDKVDKIKEQLGVDTNAELFIPLKVTTKYSQPNEQTHQRERREFKHIGKDPVTGLYPGQTYHGYSEYEKELLRESASKGNKISEKTLQPRIPLPISPRTFESEHAKIIFNRTRPEYQAMIKMMGGAQVCHNYERRMLENRTDKPDNWIFLFEEAIRQPNQGNASIKPEQAKPPVTLTKEIETMNENAPYANEDLAGETMWEEVIW